MDKSAERVVAMFGGYSAACRSGDGTEIPSPLSLGYAFKGMLVLIQETPSVVLYSFEFKSGQLMQRNQGV